MLRSYSADHSILDEDVAVMAVLYVYVTDAQDLCPTGRLRRRQVNEMGLGAPGPSIVPCEPPASAGSH